MGIGNFLKKQFIDVIEWQEQGSGVLAFRYPMQDNEIQNGGSLTVRESQMALFVNEGKVADLFSPGRHTLTTQTLPILTNLKNWDKAFQSPFKSDVYFYSTRERLDQKWGTPNPISFRDKELGPIRLRAFGSFSYKLKDPRVFYSKVSGTQDTYTTEQLDGQLRAMVTTEIGSFLGAGEVAFLDLAAQQSKFSAALLEQLKTPFAAYGLELKTFFVQSMTLPEEVQAYMDKASSIRMLGDLGKYAQFQTAEAIGNAAKNEGGIAGAGVGLGAGVSIGQMMSQAMGQMGAANSGGAAGSGGSEQIMKTIDQLHEMMKKGILSSAEFEAKKVELLKKI